jgi:phosphoribosyl 1,2-cyclic phosphate phosphodiesterase
MRIEQSVKGKLSILGCGTSTGVPVPACLCAVCRSEDQRNKRLRCSGLLSFGGKRILIDAGPDFRQQALRANIDALHAVLFTHHHADHVLGIDDLRAYNFSSGQALDIYLHDDTLLELKKMFDYIFTPVANYRGGRVAELVPHSITADTSFSILGTVVQPIEVEHGSARCFGYRFGDLAYIADCKRIDSKNLGRLRNLKTLIIDGLRFEGHPTHLCIGEAIELAKSIGAEQTYLTHLTHTVDFESASRRLPAGVMLCYDGLEIDCSLITASA